MSYICLLINRQGAVASGDSRLSLHTPLDSIFPWLQLHIDRAAKVENSRDGHLLWGCCGITSRGFIRFPVIVRRIMNDTSLTLEEKLKRIEKKVCRHTRQCQLALKWLFLTRQIRTSEDPKASFIFNMFWATFDESGAPHSGSLCIKNGKVLVSKEYHGSVFIENGMNMDKLSDRRRFAPKTSASLAELYALSNDRVRESIEKDHELKAQDPKYRATIGGPVRSVSILPCHTK